eukprot:13957564-Alexandrium_andersonii.AAC.1
MLPRQPRRALPDDEGGPDDNPEYQAKRARVAAALVATAARASDEVGENKNVRQRHRVDGEAWDDWRAR